MNSDHAETWFGLIGALGLDVAFEPMLDDDEDEHTIGAWKRFPI